MTRLEDAMRVTARLGFAGLVAWSGLLACSGAEIDDSADFAEQGEVTVGRPSADGKGLPWLTISNLNNVELPVWMPEQSRIASSAKPSTAAGTLTIQSTISSSWMYTLIRGDGGAWAKQWVWDRIHTGSTKLSLSGGSVDLLAPGTVGNATPAIAVPAAAEGQPYKVVSAIPSSRKSANIGITITFNPYRPQSEDPEDPFVSCLLGKLDAGSAQADRVAADTLRSMLWVLSNVGPVDYQARPIHGRSVFWFIAEGKRYGTYLFNDPHYAYQAADADVQDTSDLSLKETRATRAKLAKLAKTDVADLRTALTTFLTRIRNKGIRGKCETKHESLQFDYSARTLFKLYEAAEGTVSEWSEGREVTEYFLPELPMYLDDYDWTAEALESFETEVPQRVAARGEFSGFAYLEPPTLQQAVDYGLVTVPSSIRDALNASSALSSDKPNETGCAAHFVINEVSTQGQGGATDEFVEIASSNACGGSLAGHRLLYGSENATSDSGQSVIYEFGESDKVEAGGTFVLAGAGFVGPKNGLLRSGLAKSAGLRLEGPGGVTADSVSWATANSHPFCEAARAPQPTSLQSITRFAAKDTNNNAADFSLGAITASVR